MENKLDKLFRDKLEQHALAPSVHAWEKVATGLPKKNSTLNWAWRIAAAIAIVGGVSWFAFTDSQVEHLQAAQENPAKAEEVKEKLNTAPFEKRVELPTQPTVEQAPVIKRSQTQNAINAVAKVEVEAQPMPQEVSQPIEMIASVEEVEESISVEEQVIQPKQGKAMVIVFNLAPVETKQEVEPVKVTGFKKIIDFAKDVKGGETTLASVRNWKDNFLSSDEQTRVDKQNNN